LGPGHWSCGYTGVGIQNREAALRIIPAINPDDGSSHHVEFRIPDGSCNPYLVVGALVHAGIAGVQESLRLPGLLYCDPHQLTALQRKELGISELPRTLGEALDALTSDRVLSSVIPNDLLETFVAIKRYEESLIASKSEHELFEQYAAIY
jgi:glutamine synthetase